MVLGSRDYTVQTQELAQVLEFGQKLKSLLKCWSLDNIIDSYYYYLLQFELGFTEVHDLKERKTYIV